MDKILELNDKPVLHTKGSVSNEKIGKKVEKIYEKYNEKRKIYDAELADAKDMEELKQLEAEIKKAKK